MEEKKIVTGKFYATRVSMWAGIISILGLLIPLGVILFSLFGLYLYSSLTQLVLYCVMGFAMLLLIIGIIFYEKLASTQIEYITEEGKRDILRVCTSWWKREYRGPFYFNAYIQTKQSSSYDLEKRKYPAYFRIDIKLSRSKRITILEKIPKETKLPGSRRIEARLFWEPDFRSSKRFTGPLWELYKALK